MPGMRDLKSLSEISELSVDPMVTLVTIGSDEISDEARNGAEKWEKGNLRLLK